MNDIRKMIYLSLLVAIALALSVIESTIPVVFMIPGAKLGLANVITLTAIMIFGIKEAMIITSLKSILLMLITGSVTGLFYSLPSGIISTFTMYITFKYFHERKRIFSPIGVSIIGSVTHNIVQITIASILLENINIYIYMPFLLLISLFTGYFIGLASKLVSKKLKKTIKTVGD